MSIGWPVALAAVAGAAAGSFVNVCAMRWPAGQSVMSPPSRCASCGARVRWRENVPVLGYLFVRGRCSRCGVRLSVQYPLVEVAAALIWAGMAARWGIHPETLRGSLFLTVLLGIAITDARTYIIPDQFSLGGAAIGLALAPLAGGPTLAEAASGGALGFVVLWAIAVAARFFMGREAMGGGDVKMMALAGTFLGPAGVLVTLFAGSLLGSLIFGPISLRTGRLVPFGIFLALGAGIAYTWGDTIVGWYTETILGTGAQGSLQSR